MLKSLGASTMSTFKPVRVIICNPQPEILYPYRSYFYANDIYKSTAKFMRLISLAKLFFSNLFYFAFRRFCYS